MGDPFRPAARGEPLFDRIASADWYNGVNRAVKSMQGDIDLAQQQLPAKQRYITVEVVNKSGTDIERPGGVLALDSLNFSFEDKPEQVFDRPIFKGIAPTSTSDHFVILTKPLDNNQPGEGILVGAVFCRLDYTDAEHTSPRPGSVDHMTSGTSGVPIIWRELEDEEETTGEQWALVMLGGGITDHYQLIRGTVTSDVSANDATFEITSIVPLEDFARVPESPVRIANIPRFFLSAGATIVAAYRAGATTIAAEEWEGELTTRTDDNTGVVTIDPEDGHGIVTGQLADLSWSGGSREGMTVTSVGADTIALDGGTGGTGDNLPSESTAVTLNTLAFDVDWEAVFGDRAYRSEYFMLLGDTIPAGTSVEPGILWPATPGIYIYTPDGYVQITVEDIFGQEGTVGIYNPFPYAARAGFYPVEFQHVTLDGEDVSYWFSITGFDLKSFQTTSNTPTTVLGRVGSGIEWVDASGFEGEPGPPYDDGPILDAINNLQSQINAQPDTEGYCITIDGTTIHHDAITTDAGATATDRALDKFQFWMHHPGASTRTDAKWRTIEDYDGTDSIQLPGHEDGDWNFRTIDKWLETVEDYAVGASASDMQFITHFQPGGGPVIWKPATDYDVTKKQVLVNETGAWIWRNRIPIGGAGDGDGVVSINSVNSVDLSFDSEGVLKVQINYTTYSVLGTAGSGGNASDTLTIWAKDTTNVVTDVDCVEDELVVTDESIDILTPP
jgi:hypothetical protein